LSWVTAWYCVILRHSCRPAAGKKAKKKSKKKKGAVKLDADQEALAVAASGCLQAIAVVDKATCCLLAGMGASKWLVALAESPNVLLRGHCQVGRGGVLCCGGCGVGHGPLDCLAAAAVD